jgi:hypothetical protein
MTLLFQGSDVSHLLLLYPEHFVHVPFDLENKLLRRDDPN